MPQPLLIIACGALAREIIALRQANDWSSVVVQCLPADLHNRPERIPAALRDKLDKVHAQYRQILLAYGDCGTGGQLDALLESYRRQGINIERIFGAHCYEFYAGSALFQALSDAEPGTFYLTDFLARHFERIVWQGLGIAQHPQLLEMYFGHYRKLVYLAQTEQRDLYLQAQQAASRLGLSFDYRWTGYGGLQQTMQRWVAQGATAP